MREKTKCSCGCETVMDLCDSRGRERKFLYGHGNKNRKHPGLKHDKQFKSGHRPHNKDLAGYSNAGTFKVGHQPLLFKHSPESIEKMKSSPNLGRFKIGQESHNKGKTLNYRGEKHWNWKGGITKKDHIDRVRFVKYFSPRILARDNYTCQVCDEQGVHLHADHIKGWSEYPELRFNLDNCRAVCRPCHYYLTFKKKMPSGSAWGLTSARRKECS